MNIDNYEKCSSREKGNNDVVIERWNGNKSGLLLWLFLFLLGGEIGSCLYANGKHLVKRKTIGDAGEAGGNAKANSEKAKGNRI